MGADLKLRFDAGDALEFAKKHDPMPVHVGGDAAGGVLPPGTMSGMYVASVVQRAITDAVVAAGWVVDAGLSFAIDWKRPMFPDDKPATAQIQKTALWAGMLLLLRCGRKRNMFCPLEYPQGDLGVFLTATLFCANSCEPDRALAALARATVRALNP